LADTFNMAADQVIGSAVNFINQTRIQKLKEELIRIFENETSSIRKQDQNFLDAMAEVKKIYDFLASDGHILGSPLTKHGEIAEKVEVHIRNAFDKLEGTHSTATFDGVGRTAPEDYRINGIKVQLKFINGINNNLAHVLKHLDQYPEFGRDGSLYQIPKDTYDAIQKILNGNPPAGLSRRTMEKIIEKVAEIEKRTGKSFSEVVKPSISKYSEVQKGVVKKTIKNYEKDLASKNEQKKAAIHKNADQSRQEAEQRGKSSVQEGIKAGLIGALMGGGLSIGLSIYKKYREGKSIFQFDENDWKDIGIDFAKGGIKGGVSGFSIYGLTNYTNMGAPMASAFVSTAFGVLKLSNDYNDGKINMDEFIVQGQIICAEAGIVALGAAAGQTLIPIPVIGSLIGSFATSTFMSLTKRYLTDSEREISAKLQEIYNEAINNIQTEYQKIVKAILQEYNRLGTITKMAFDFQCNAILRFEQSQKLANEYGVRTKRILTTVSEIDDYFLK